MQREDVRCWVISPCTLITTRLYFDTLFSEEVTLWYADNKLKCCFDNKIKIFALTAATFIVNFNMRKTFKFDLSLGFFWSSFFTPFFWRHCLTLHTVQRKLILPLLASNKYSAFPVLICVFEHGTGRAAVFSHLRTHRFPGGPVQGQFLVVSAPCKVSQWERAVKPGSCHHIQHLKVLWKTNSPFECCLKYFPTGKYVCFLFFPVTFHWPWCLALVRFTLGN